MTQFIDKFLKKTRKVPPIASVVVPAAGSASRMEGIDKILTPLGDCPILVHTLLALEACNLIHEIIVVTRADLIVPISHLCQEYGITKAKKVIVGGKERIHSVRMGVAEVRKDAELIAIHDGARPFPSQELLREVFSRAAVTGAAAPAIPVTDTIKRVEGNIVKDTVDRDTLRAVQTPQVFDAGLIASALEKALLDGAILTDDCAAVERLGMQVSLTAGEKSNIKVTTPIDMMIAQAILETREDW